MQRIQAERKERNVKNAAQNSITLNAKYSACQTIPTHDVLRVPVPTPPPPPPTVCMSVVRPCPFARTNEGASTECIEPEYWFSSSHPIQMDNANDCSYLAHWCPHPPSPAVTTSHHPHWNTDSQSGLGETWNNHKNRNPTFHSHCPSARPLCRIGSLLCPPPTTTTVSAMNFPRTHDEDLKVLLLNEWQEDGHWSGRMPTTHSAILEFLPNLHVIVVLLLKHCSCWLAGVAASKNNPPKGSPMAGCRSIA